jgi:hypothetical protein
MARITGKRARQIDWSAVHLSSFPLNLPLSNPTFPIRDYRPGDLETIKRLTTESFRGVTLEENVENALGLLRGHDWRWRKARHIDDDVAMNPGGIFRRGM